MMMQSAEESLARAREGKRLSDTQALALLDIEATKALSEVAEALCLSGHGHAISYSKKVFIPLTKLCRDVCHYCTFAHPPRDGAPAFLSEEEVLEVARAGAAAGCNEALFTLGDKPEMRYRVAREALDEMGFASTLDYLEHTARRVIEETGLLPHLNPGLMDEGVMRRLRAVSVSQGIMLESASERLCEPGGPHYGSPDKHPEARLETIAAAGRAGVPFTTGILIGIGETRQERIETLLAIRALHEQYGHIQEVIVQNFRAKPGTRMSDAPEPSLEEQVWTIAVARLIFGPEMNIQSPPNLRPEGLAPLVRAGLNDWGGVSPVTPDHVNPEAPWPHLDRLAQASRDTGRTLTERLPIYREYAAAPERWIAPEMRSQTLRMCATDLNAREDEWYAGASDAAPQWAQAAVSRADAASPVSPDIARALDRAEGGESLTREEIVRLFGARGDDFSAVCEAADRMRAQLSGDSVTYVINRNINYTNICTYGCGFCAFSKGRLSQYHRDKPYDLPLDEIAGRAREAWQRGATEVCLQGGIRPGYTGETYLAILDAVKTAVPEIHVHAFSPLEVWHGATSLGLPLSDYLRRLKDGGLASLPGTAAEVLDDEVRDVLCADKINTAQWLEVMRTAHEVGLKSTSTIMFGHVDSYGHWANHLLRLRDLQTQTGGFTEFVPLAFVHMEAPIYLKGQARPGPTFRESVLMHAVARLVLSPGIANIQASWVKMGRQGAALCLDAGANDFGGVLMNESITRAAGASHGQELRAADIEALIRACGRVPRQRLTDYRLVDAGPLSDGPAQARFTTAAE
jgi:FO synthase